MGRLLDSDTVKKALCDAVDDISRGYIAVYGIEEDDIEGIIDSVPSVQPEPKWIPCSKTVDIPDHEILACDKYGEEMFGYLAYKDDQWLCESDDCMMYDPIAWREKPEPYREEEEQMRAIDADEFDKCLEDAEEKAIHMQKYVFASALNTIRGNLRIFPTIEPERKKGKWIKLDMHAHLADHKCTACGQECYVPTCMGEPMYSYCPNCGAKMKEGKQE